MFAEPTHFDSRLVYNIEKALIGGETEFLLQGFVASVQDGFICLDRIPTAVKAPASVMMLAHTLYAVAMNNRVKFNDQNRKGERAVKHNSPKGKRGRPKKETPVKPAKKTRKPRKGNN